MEQNTDRMGFALIALSVVAFVLVIMNTIFAPMVMSHFKGIQKWSDNSFSNLNYVTVNPNVWDMSKTTVSHQGSYILLGSSNYDSNLLPANVTNVYRLTDAAPAKAQNNVYANLYSRFMPDLKPIAGDTYTMSGWVKKPTTMSSSDFFKYLSVGYFETRIDGTNWVNGVLSKTSIVKQQGDWMYVSGSFIIKSDVTVPKVYVFGFTYPDELRGNVSADIGGIKLEHGSIATMY